MSLIPTAPTLSITRPKDWATVLVIIVVVCVPTAEIQSVLASMIALAAVLVSGSTVKAVAARQPSRLCER
ncbi:hypothetical protein SAFG77S_06354 [Streptomyces afghaniensis]